MFIRGTELAVVKINLDPKLLFFCLFTQFFRCLQRGLKADAGHEYPLIGHEVVEAGKRCIVFF